MSEGTRLQPEQILHVATQTESVVWSQGGLTEEREGNLDQDSADIGMCILQHGTSAKEIHNYFMSLEQRKCCLLLAVCKQRFSSVRLVRNDGRDSGIEEGAMMKSSLDTMETVTHLDAEDFQVFQQTLKCAAFPVLGAPEPPSESTPVPMGTSGMMNSKRKETGGTLQYHRTMTPLSLHDSGVEEQEDTAMVPAETLCELLRRAFRLTHDKFNQYEALTAAQLDKKSPQKILAEELVRQLIALENNQNPYYNPRTFLNRIGYDQWQQRERTHITELLSKFWHFSLPQMADRSITMTSMHKQYRKLLEKLISYESPYRQHNELIAPPPTSPLSSASVRLLKEFGLRYGVGEQYRRIVYLSYLSLNFDPTVWFVHHVMSSLTSVMEAMPTKRSCLIIVKEEFSILENSLHLLEAKSSAAIAKMKTLFTNNRPLDGVEPLIELLSLTLRAKTYLLMSPEEQLGNRLYKIVQGIFPTAYERHKMVAQDELRHNKWDTELSPKLINMLIGYVRDEVLDYKQFYQPAFQKYFNITGEAAQEFYKLLMADVSELLGQTRANQVLACLRYLAKGDFYSEVGDIHGISKSSMSRILTDFLISVNSKLDNIRFPRERDLQDEVKRGFYQTCGIPGVIGAIDGTFIPIIAPIEHEEVFVCRKGYHAMNIQAVVDTRMKFLDVVAKWPGSTHDAAILDSCALKNYLERACPGHLLGDSGYPLREYLMTPIMQPTTPAQHKYNKAHATGRVVIERAFGVLKSRFRCLHKSGGCLPFQPSKCVQVVSACVRLHNLCQDRNIPVTSLVTEGDSDDDTQIQPNTGSGHNRRQSIVQLFQ